MTDLRQDGAAFLAGGGEMGELTRRHAWHETSLGAPGEWPQTLKVAVRLLLSSGHPMFIWWGPELVQFYNDAYRGSLGPERHPSALGQPGRECWQEIWPIIAPQIHQVMAGEGSTWRENHLVPATRHGKQEAAYWTYSYSPIDDPTAPNGVGGVLVICSETTRQVQSGFRWRTAEAKWRALFDQAQVFMCTLAGPEHVFEYANAEYLKLVGDRNVLGKPVKDALPELDRQGFIELLDRVYYSGKAYRGDAVPVDLVQSPQLAPERRFVDFVYQALTNEQNEIAGIFVVGYDVTDRMKAGERLQDQDRRKDEFLAMLAHELRNPLAPIANVASWLVQSTIDDTEVKRAGEVLQRQCGQLRHLVDDLLDVSRITRGKIELKLEPVEVDKAVKFALESAQPMLKVKRHDLLYQRGEGELYVQGDQPRLVQCLCNILTNAIKYTPAEGFIRLSVERIGTSVNIRVVDNGIGISQDVLPKIFDLFTQADSTSDRAQGGLGVGLSIVQRLIMMHGGTTEVTSEGLGHGSQFTIQLPLIDPPEQRVQQVSADSGTRFRILIVDDNIDAAESLARLLEFKGHETAAVHNGREGLQRIATFAPDVALLDIGLPDMDGYELARLIRSRLSTVLLVALTGYGSPEDCRRSLDAGFDHHLTKPTSLSELETILQKDTDDRVGT